MEEELFFLHGCTQERRLIFFLDLSLFGKNFSSPIFYCITSREVSFWCSKISKKRFQKPFKKGGEEERQDAWYVGWTSPSSLIYLGDKKKEKRDAYIIWKKERGCLIWGVGNFSHGEERCGVRNKYHMGFSSWLSPIPNRIQDLFQFLTNF